MTKNTLIYLILMVVVLAACSQGGESKPTLTPPPAPTEEITEANADVLFVQAVENEDRSWTFSVTVEHPDSGWEDYADGWDVVLPDGTVIKPNPEEAFTRVLLHPHENEQPFTRSQDGIVIPASVNQVTVRAHDLVDGFGGQEVVVQLDESSGQNFEVERLEGSNAQPALGVTNQRLDGNRLTSGYIDLLNSEPVEILLAGVPVWVVGVPDSRGNPVWVAALEDGRLQGFANKDGAYEAIELPADALPAGMPPAISYQEGEVVILNSLAANLAEFTHPILTPSRHLAYINDAGAMSIQAGEETAEINVDAMKDGRLLSNGEGNLLLLSAPTSIYEHAVLGDGIEAKSVTMLTEKGDFVDRLSVFSESVIEGIAPIWADVDGDGAREVIVTLSNRREGAQLAVFSESGALIAQSDSIGTGFRWRHQIAAAAFGSNGEMEIVDVLTPHLGGVVEFFRLEGEKLVKTAELPGFTSHVIGSRNLDMAFAGDLDADGQIELVLPRQDLSSLGVLERTADGAAVAGEIALAGRLASNLAAVTLPGGGLAVAAGLESGVLWVWLP